MLTPLNLNLMFISTINKKRPESAVRINYLSYKKYFLQHTMDESKDKNEKL